MTIKVTHSYKRTGSCSVLTHFHKIFPQTDMKELASSAVMAPTTMNSSELDKEERFEEESGKPTTTAERIDPRERHRLAEKERRRSMRELFLSLHSILPHSQTVPTEQLAILDEVVNYIPVAQSRLRTLRSNRRSSSSSAPATCVEITSRSSNFDIRVAPEPGSSVSIRVRGDRVCVSLTDGKGTSQAALLSAVLDELDAHSLTVVRSTHCREGSKLRHYSECKISNGMDKSPDLLKARLQELAAKLHSLKTPASSSPAPCSSKLKRKFDPIV